MDGGAPPGASTRLFQHCSIFAAIAAGRAWRKAAYLEQAQAAFSEQVAIQKINADVDQETASRYGIFTVPTTLVVDRKGIVRHINYGLTDVRKLTHQLATVAAD